MPLLDTASIAYLTELGKEHQDLALHHVYAKDNVMQSYYNYHWSMVRLTDTLIRKPYMKKLTDN